jgi:ABC-2 type transport system ATP-binding protein
MAEVYAEHLLKRYSNGVWGVRDVSLEARRGEVLVVLGPNGAGKTTTINILSTLIKPTGGLARVMGYDVYREYREIRKHIALMPQGGSINPSWTPLYAVKWYLVARGFSLSDAEREARRWLEEIGLWDLRDRSGYALSGGERRRVLLAMTLATGAEILFLDEPSVGLDVESKYVLWSAIRKYSAGRCVIYTTHEMKEVENIADKILIIDNGVSKGGGDFKKLMEVFPYKYKVVVRSGDVIAGNEHVKIKTGDFTRVYFKERSEALDYLYTLRDFRDVSIREVDVEDIYLFSIKSGEVGL